MAKSKTKKDSKQDRSAHIRTLTDDQISTRVVDIAKEQMNLRFQKAGGQASNPKAGFVLRKEVARLKTEQSARRNTKTA